MEGSLPCVGLDFKSLRKDFPWLESCHSNQKFFLRKNVEQLPARRSVRKGFTPNGEEQDRSVADREVQDPAGSVSGLDSQKEVSGCHWDCWSPGEADGSVHVLYSLFEHFPVLSQKDPVSQCIEGSLEFMALTC